MCYCCLNNLGWDFFQKHLNLARSIPFVFSYSVTFGMQVDLHDRVAQPFVNCQGTTQSHPLCNLGIAAFHRNLAAFRAGVRIYEATIAQDSEHPAGASPQPGQNALNEKVCDEQQITWRHQVHLQSLGQGIHLLPGQFTAKQVADDRADGQRLVVYGCRRA